MFALPSPFLHPLRTLPALAAFASALACGGPSVELDVDLLQVVHASPAHGSVGVGTNVLPLVGLSQEIEGDLTQFHLEVKSGEGFDEVPARKVRRDEGMAVMFVPDNVLDGGMEYRIRIEEGVESVDGMPLSVEFRSDFTTQP